MIDYLIITQYKYSYMTNTKVIQAILFEVYVYLEF
jgi:hypothetical protein